VKARHAIPARLPDFVEPMKAKLAHSMPSGGAWIYDIKFNGYRALALRGGGETRILLVPPQQKLALPAITTAFPWTVAQVGTQLVKFKSASRALVLGPPSARATLSRVEMFVLLKADTA
jgi:hypothetical protein